MNKEDSKEELKLSKILDIIDLVNLKKGDEVFHNKLGRGKVSQIEIPSELIESIRRLKCEFVFEQREEPFTLLLPLAKLKRILNSENTNENSLLDFSDD